MQRSPWSVFRKPQFFHTFSVILILSNYKIVWQYQGFLKTDHGILCTPDLRYGFFELVSYSFQRESIKYMSYMNSGRIAGFEFQYKSLNFPPSCPDYPWCNYDCEFLYYLGCRSLRRLKLNITLSQYFVFYSGAMTMLAKATAICSICSNYRKIRTSFPLIYDRVFLLAYDKIWNGVEW